MHFYGFMFKAEIKLYNFSVTVEKKKLKTTNKQ